MSCSLVKIYLRFGGKYFFHVYGLRASQTNKFAYQKIAAFLVTEVRIVVTFSEKIFGYFINPLMM
jgi:hypothetical protein